MSGITSVQIKEERMKEWQMCRAVGTGLLIVGLAFQASPIVWAQLQEVDPALDAAVSALVAHDPEVASDPELAQLCRQVAESTVLDPRERAAVTSEVAAIHREGIDINTVIPTEVREAAREEFAKVQGQMKEQLETLRATDPEKAKEIELMMREGEQCMRAFETGERYVPSAEMVAHAEGMFKDWESDAIAHGTPPEFVERARMEFASWSSGEMGSMMGGPGHEMMGPGGPGHEGGMPSLDQMEQMVAGGQMTPEQLQMAKDYMDHGQQMEQQYRELGQQMEQQYREMYTPENQTYDTKQQQQFDLTQPPPTEYKIREDAHVADHNGDFIPETHMHEVFRHTQGTPDLSDDTCHDHAMGATVGC